MALPWGIEIGMNLATVLLVVASVMVLSIAGMDQIRRAVPGINMINRGQVSLVLILAIVGLAVFAPAGPAADFAGDLSPASTATDDSGDYWDTTDLTVYARDADTGATVDGTVEFFGSGSSDADIAKATGNADKLGSLTLTSGSATYNGFDTLANPSPLILVDNSSYYDEIVSKDVRVSNGLDDNAKDVNVQVHDIGTINVSKSSTSVSATAGNSFTYTAYYLNEEDDSEIRKPVLKLSSTTNVTLDSVDSGGTLEEVSGTKYIVLSDEVIGENEVSTVQLTFTYAAGSGSGAFDLVYDDLWQAYGDSDIQTDSDVNDATSVSSTVSVS